MIPDERHPPTLLMAKSVTTSTVEVDDTWDHDGDSIFFGSRPMTPAGISSSSEFAPGLHTQPAHERQDTSSTDAPLGGPRRRSFSIGDLLSTGPSSKKSRLSTPLGRKLLRKARISSAPTLSIHTPAVLDAKVAVERPSKRRDITDPTIFKREIYSSDSSRSPLTPLTPGTIEFSRPASALQTSHSDLQQLPRPQSQSDPKPGFALSHTAPPQPPLAFTQPHSTQTAPPSAAGASNVNPLLRSAAASSERTSTLVGSDNDVYGPSSEDEEEVDPSSKETVRRAFRARVRRNVSGARGPRIETIFDESPQKPQQPRIPPPERPFRGIDEGLTLAMSAKHRDATRAEAEPISTRQTAPAWQKRPDTADEESEASFNSRTISSHAATQQTPDLGTSDWDVDTDDREEVHWSFDDDDDTDHDDSPHTAAQVATPLRLKRSNPLVVLNRRSMGTPQYLAVDITEKDKDAKSSIFDWSEQAPTDKSPGNRTPPRPKTVHGKKDSGKRDSRSVGRRAPSAMHTRSHSVPVVPDAAGTRDTVALNKFGTWGVGTKVVSEDWDEDFDFPDGNEQQLLEEKRVDSGMAMIIPQTIREQQNNVVANIGLLREWGILIEELKALRIRAVHIGMMDGPHAKTWEEVDAMIELADQEAEDSSAGSKLSPPSSPGFDVDAFDEEFGRDQQVRNKRQSGPTVSANHADSASVVVTTGKSRRKSVLPSESDVFSGAVTDGTTTPDSMSITQSQRNSGITTRPRKDSEAVARSVIEAIQKKHTSPAQGLEGQPAVVKKVPFDTATLRHIVPYVKGLMRKVQEAVRETEGLHSSPNPSPGRSQEPPFSQIFRDPPEGSESPSPRRSRQSRPKNMSRRSDENHQPKENELNKQMKLMTVM